MRETILAEQTHAFIRSQPWQAAVLPIGATEPHNLHMPYGTDNFQVEEIGRRACEFAAREGGKVLLLPTIPFGVNTNHLQIPGAVACSLTPTTLLAILTDLTDSLERQGIRKLVLLNGHGGNELKPLTRELHHRTKVFLCVCDWYRMAADVYLKFSRNPASTLTRWKPALASRTFRPWSTPSLRTMVRPVRPGSRRSTRAGSASRDRGTWSARTPAWAIHGRRPRRKAGS